MKRARRGPVERLGVRMLARVARDGRATRPPRARGFLGKANPPRVSRGLRVRREPRPMDGRWTFLHRARPATRRRRRRGGAGFWTPPSPKGRRERGKSRSHPPVPGGKRMREPRRGAVPEKPLSVKGARARTADRRRWAGRAYRGDRANRGQGTRQNRPVTSGEGALLSQGAAAKRPRRLFTKNTGRC